MMPNSRADRSASSCGSTRVAASASSALLSIASAPVLEAWRPDALCGHREADLLPVLKVERPQPYVHALVHHGAVSVPLQILLQALAAAVAPAHAQLLAAAVDVKALDELPSPPGVRGCAEVHKRIPFEDVRREVGRHVDKVEKAPQVQTPEQSHKLSRVAAPREVADHQRGVLCRVFLLDLEVLAAWHLPNPAAAHATAAWSFGPSLELCERQHWSPAHRTAAEAHLRRARAVLKQHSAASASAPEVGRRCRWLQSFGPSPLRRGTPVAVPARRARRRARGRRRELVGGLAAPGQGAQRCAREDKFAVALVSLCPALQRRASPLWRARSGCCGLTATPFGGGIATSRGSVPSPQRQDKPVILGRYLEVEERVLHHGTGHCCRLHRHAS
mmetsp:Transcript_66234/g.153813  ORF Transcript_66234/g.153813 Transcript_66234/m.153813 type:complete len:389 (-) Transcript_66234:14-1180(-)